MEEIQGAVGYKGGASYPDFRKSGRPSGGSDIYIVTGTTIGSQSGKGELGRGS